MRRLLSLFVVFLLALSLLAFGAGTGAGAATGPDIVVLGGPSVVSDLVVAQLEACTSGKVTRIAGTDRYATAAAISAKTFSPGVSVVAIATGEAFPDALAGGAAAGGSGGSVLLSTKTSLPAATVAELTRLQPKQIVVLGGTNAISPAVQASLTAYTTGLVTRISGSDRYSTAVAASAAAFSPATTTAYVATGLNFPDALAGGPAAIKNNGPMLLVQPTAIPGSVRAELTRLGLSNIVILGGTTAVSSAVETDLGSYAGTVTRISGSNRHATAAAVSAATFPSGAGTIFVATGENFPDALAGGPAAAAGNGPMLLVNKHSVPQATANELSRLTGQSCGDLLVGQRLPGESLWAMVPGNDLSADRINLVFAPSGFSNQTNFIDMAGDSLSWSGDPYLIDSTQKITHNPSQATGAQLGTFAIEPWRSSRDRFNVWYTNVSPSFPAEWLNNENHPFSHIPNVSILTYAFDAHLDNPNLTSVSGQDNVFMGPGAPVRPSSGNPFANALAVIRGDLQSSGLSDVPHEFGHALLNLADEYVGQRLGYDGRPDLSSWPSCAEDMAEATAWWGGLIGQVDPMMTTWANEMSEAGFPLDVAFLSEQVKVANVDGGCYGPTGSFRATTDSLMNSNMPVLGSVNRAWAQQIIDLWAGKPR